MYVYICYFYLCPTFILYIEKPFQKSPNKYSAHALRLPGDMLKVNTCPSLWHPLNLWVALMRMRLSGVGDINSPALKPKLLFICKFLLPLKGMEKMARPLILEGKK